MKKLGFGLMRLPLLDEEDTTSIDLEALKKMVDAYLNRGFTYFDTAYMYHKGRSEAAIREALVKRYPRSSFTLADKMPVAFMASGEEHESIFEEQRQRCGVEYFDYYLAHNMGAANYKKAEEFGTFQFLQEKKREGKIKKVGFSFHDNAKLLDQILTEHPEVEFVQLQINYMDWENESIQSKLCLETARSHGKPVIVMEPLKGGTLAKLPGEAEALLKESLPNQSIPSWAIRFAAGQEGVMMVLSGMSDASQLEDNMSYMEEFHPLSGQETERLQGALEMMKNAAVIPCTACQYCVDECPKGIAIPKYFALYNNEKQSPAKGVSIPGVYYNNYTQNHGKASDCIECRKCEGHCPQQLKITELLRAVARQFEAGE